MHPLPAFRQGYPRTVIVWRATKAYRFGRLYFFVMDIFIFAEIILSVISFFFMRLDKFFAVKNLRRIPEKVLLFLILLGPCGGLLSMHLKLMYGRHKTKKPAFHAAVIGGLIIHAAILFLIIKFG